MLAVFSRPLTCIARVRASVYSFSAVSKGFRHNFPVVNMGKKNKKGSKGPQSPQGKEGKKPDIAASATAGAGKVTSGSEDTAGEEEKPWEKVVQDDEEPAQTSRKQKTGTNQNKSQGGSPSEPEMSKTALKKLRQQERKAEEDSAASSDLAMEGEGNAKAENTENTSAASCDVVMEKEDTAKEDTKNVSQADTVRMESDASSKEESRASLVDKDYGSGASPDAWDASDNETETSVTEDFANAQLNEPESHEEESPETEASDKNGTSNNAPSPTKEDEKPEAAEAVSTATDSTSSKNKRKKGGTKQGDEESTTSTGEAVSSQSTGKTKANVTSPPEDKQQSKKMKMQNGAKDGNEAKGASGGARPKSEKKPAEEAPKNPWEAISDEDEPPLLIKPNSGANKNASGDSSGKKSKGQKKAEKKEKKKLGGQTVSGGSVDARGRDDIKKSATATNQNVKRSASNSNSKSQERSRDSSGARAEAERQSRDRSLSGARAPQWAERQSSNRSQSGGRRPQGAFKLQYEYGNLFRCAPTEALAHCVSRDMAMGKGIALTFKEMFGGVAELKSQRKTVGDVAILQAEGSYIYYMVTKERYFDKPTYQTLESSLKAMKKDLLEKDIKGLSMPMIGCGLDKLVWEKVEKMLYTIFSDTNLTVTIYEYKKK